MQCWFTIDEKFPIKFNRRKQTITIPDIFLSTEVLQLKKHRFSNIAMKDVIASFKNGAIKYSGEIVDLDLLNIYFDEVLNIQGVFSGINNQIKFAITPSQSFIKNKDTANRISTCFRLNNTHHLFCFIIP